MSPARLRNGIAGRWPGLAAAGTALAGATLMLASAATPVSAVTGTWPRPAPAQVAGVASTYWNTLHLFYQAADHSLVHKTSTAGAWAVQSLGGRLASGPAAITTGAEFDSTFVFARGTDNAIWTRSVGGEGLWGPWTSLGGRALGAPAVSGVGDVTYPPTIWVRGADGALWQRSYAGGGWRYLGGKILTDPAAVPALGGAYPNVRDVFALGTDHAVWEFTTAWHRVGGRSTVAPAVVNLTNGRTFLFARGTDNALWVTTRAPTATTFGRWQRIGGILTSAPTATIYPYTGYGSALCVFALGADGNLWWGRQALSGGGWSWQPVA